MKPGLLKHGKNTGLARSVTRFKVTYLRLRGEKKEGWGRLYNVARLRGEKKEGWGRLYNEALSDTVRMLHTY